MPGVFRRVFTLLAVLFFALLFAARFFAQGDPRYSILGIGLVLHQDNRMAVIVPGHHFWAFSYAPLYLPGIAGFLGCAVWNWVIWRRNRPDARLLLNATLIGAISIAIALLSIAFYPDEVIFPFGLSVLVSLLAIACIVAISVRREAIHSARDRRLCRHCQYDLTGNVSGTCPECGTAIFTKVKLPA